MTRGEGVITNWCASVRKEMIAPYNAKIAALERRNAVLVGALTNARNQLRVARDGIDADHPMHDYFVSAIKAADSALAAQER